jgi:cold shock CspA family protein
MQTETQITFENMPGSDALRAHIMGEVIRLERYAGRITSCRVVVRAPGHAKRQGGLFDVRIHLTLPGHKEVVVDRLPPKHHAYADPYVALHDAFAAAKRQLQDQVRVLRADVKQHDEPAYGVIDRLNADDGFGFITAADGSEIYFHRNVIPGDGFEKLRLGTRVRYAALEGDKGLQAHTVHIIER